VFHLLPLRYHGCRAKLMACNTFMAIESQLGAEMPGAHLVLSDGSGEEHFPGSRDMRYRKRTNRFR
jgi:hypothetical protein